MTPFDIGGGGFRAYAAGAKRYGAGQTMQPTMGPVDPTGYIERDLKVKARKKAMMNAMRTAQGGAMANPSVMRVL